MSPLMPCWYFTLSDSFIAKTPVGVVAGLAGSAVMTRFLRSLLFGVKATDPLTLGGVAAGLAIVSVAACYFPARRATRVDPLVALRHE